MTTFPSAPPEGRDGVRPGVRLGHYEVLARLGSGGMATVWLGRAVRHDRFERLVAIKTVHPELSADRRSRELFLREAELASTIHHANVLDVFDMGDADGVLYQVMTLVEGRDLRVLMDRFGAPLPAPVLVSVLVDALRGLHAAHESRGPNGHPRGLVHRDVSPQNILVGLDGVARLADFGIARSLASPDETTTALRGKFSYFSPEQASRGPVDRRTDVFAMGILLWEGLTGERLFRGLDPLESIQLVKEKPIVHPAEVRAEIARELGDVAMKALARDPDGRFATAAEMGGALVAAARSARVAFATDDVARFVETLSGDEIRERIRSSSLPHAAPEKGRAQVEGDATASYVPTHAPVGAPNAGRAASTAVTVSALPVNVSALPVNVSPQGESPPKRPAAPRARRGWIVFSILALALAAASLLLLTRGPRAEEDALSHEPRATPVEPATASQASQASPVLPPPSAASSTPSSPASPSAIASTALPSASESAAPRARRPPRTTGTSRTPLRDPPYTQNPFTR